MKFTVGIFLPIFGILALLFGHKTIQENSGKITKVVSLSKFQSVLVKWAIGVLLLALGITFMIN